MVAHTGFLNIVEEKQKQEFQASLSNRKETLFQKTKRNNGTKKNVSWMTRETEEWVRALPALAEHLGFDSNH